MKDAVSEFSFNLWHEPWIDLETLDGKVERKGIGDTLANAHNYRGIYSHSPLEVAGVHRLLTAILQDALIPQGMDDLAHFWDMGNFPPDALERFISRYLHRFDLFSETEPFLQSGDLPIKPEKKSDGKTVAYLIPEIPAGTNIIHFQHNTDDEHIYCPVCCARGLVIIPAFSTTGGSGIKPSINGVPPVYILPGGNNMFESLLASLVLPEFQPVVRDTTQDMAWWKHPPVVQKSHEVGAVGYLHSLTFPARRVRLHPIKQMCTCSHCGHQTSIGVRTMIFEMGEFRHKESAFWQDPFAAYQLRLEKPPLPVRPSPGKALWREYSGLFLKMPAEFSSRKGRKPVRPRVIDQLALLQSYEVGPSNGTIPFRCIGLRTDMKAKLFEWIDTGFDVPLTLLQNSAAGPDVEDGIEFSAACVDGISATFMKHLNEAKGTRDLHVKTALIDAAWADLAEPFRAFLLELAGVYAAGLQDNGDASKQVLHAWYNQVIKILLARLEDSLEKLGDSGRSLRIRYEILTDVRKLMYGKLKKKEEGLNERG